MGRRSYVQVGPGKILGRSLRCSLSSFVCDLHKAYTITRGVAGGGGGRVCFPNTSVT